MFQRERVGVRVKLTEPAGPACPTTFPPIVNPEVPPLPCTVCVREETFESLWPEWTRLIASRSGFTVFDTPLWQRTWWDEFGQGSALRLISVCEDGSKPLLIAPMVMCEGTASFLGGTDLVDYHDFLAPDGPVAGHIEAVVKALTEESGCRVIELFSIPGGSPTLEAFPACARAGGWQVETAQEDVAPRMDLPASWEAYVEALPKHDRHELRRKMRRIEAAGEVRDYELRAPEEIAAGFDNFMSLHRMSMPEKAVFMTPERERFFRRVAAELAREGVARLRFLEFNGKRVATSLSWVVGGTRYLYNSGYDPEHRDLAVGLMNHAYSIRASIAEGLKIYDFMRGNEAYKYHLGGKDRPVFKMTARR